MPGPSIYHWKWTKRPDARIEKGLILEGNEMKPYHPGEYKKELLNAIRGITDEKTALEFTKQWGVLGLKQNAALIEDLNSQISGAFEFTYAARKKENPDIDPNSVLQEVFLFFNPEGGIYLTPKGEPVSAIIYFAQRIGYLLEAKRLSGLYREDLTAAACEAEEWLNNLPPEWYEDLSGESLQSSQEQYVKQYGQGHKEPGFHKYVLDLIIHTAQFSFSQRSERSIWIQLDMIDPDHSNKPTGQPVIQFDGLFRFIEYILLVEGGPSPKRCADPKCGQIFFPAKADQEYCPPPPGVKRSRCENRHGQWLRRHGIQKPKIKKGEG